MLIKRYPTKHEQAIAGAKEILLVLGKRDVNKGEKYNLDYFSALSMSLQSLSEEGFAFEATNQLYKQFRDKIFGERGIKERELIQPSDIELAEKVRIAALEDIVAQKWRGLVHAA